MPTLKAALSQNNPYWIPKERYYELKYFCLQYPHWKVAYHNLNGLEKHSDYVTAPSNPYSSDPTAKTASRRSYFSDRMDMVKKAAIETDSVIGSYIFKAVINGFSYDVINARESVPCSRCTYYELYRKFFFILDKIRG